MWQIAMLYLLRYYNDIGKFWNSLKICLLFSK